MTLWEQYNPERSISAAIEASFDIALDGCDEKEVYACVKRHLTRKELKCFVMQQAGRPLEAIAGETGSDAAEVSLMLEKIRMKFRRPKLANDLRRGCRDTEK